MDGWMFRCLDGWTHGCVENSPPFQSLISTMRQPAECRSSPSGHSAFMTMEVHGEHLYPRLHGLPIAFPLLVSVQVTTELLSRVSETPAGQALSLPKVVAVWPPKCLVHKLGLCHGLCLSRCSHKASCSHGGGGEAF